MLIMESQIVKTPHLLNDVYSQNLDKTVYNFCFVYTR